jgi:hypothetical protein
VVLSGRRRRSPPLVLLLAALLSAGLWRSELRDCFHPFALLASLLPLQLAALFWCLRAGATAAEHRGSVRKPPASG